MPRTFHRRSLNRAIAIAAISMALTSVTSAPAKAWIRDQNSNRIDDTLERVDALGESAAFVNGRQAIGVTAGPTLTYPVRVRYDHMPSAADIAALMAAGAPWTRPYLDIPYVRTEARSPRSRTSLRCPASPGSKPCPGSIPPITSVPGRCGPATPRAS